MGPGAGCVAGAPEQAQQLDVAHRRPQVLVEGGKGVVGDVVVGGDAPQIRGLKVASPPVVLDQVVLVQLRRRSVHQVHAALLQGGRSEIDKPEHNVLYDTPAAGTGCRQGTAVS